MFPSLLILIRFIFNRRADRRRPGSLGFSIFLGLNARNPTLMLANNKGADQPAHPRSLVSAFVIRYLKSKVTRSDNSLFSILFGGLQHDEASGYALVQILHLPCVSSQYPHHYHHYYHAYLDLHPPHSGLVLDCIDSWSLPSFSLLIYNIYSRNIFEDLPNYISCSILSPLWITVKFAHFLEGLGSWAINKIKRMKQTDYNYFSLILNAADHRVHSEKCPHWIPSIFLPLYRKLVDGWTFPIEIMKNWNVNRNCLGQFREIPWNQTTDVHRGTTLITWRLRHITWRWRHRNHVITITSVIATIQTA